MTLNPDAVQPAIVTSDKDKVLDQQQLEHVHDDDPESGKKKLGANTQLDDAARILDEAGGHIDASMEDRKRVLRRIDIFVCIPMCIVYWLQQLDKSAVSYAAVFNLQTETNLQGSEYSWLTSVVYISQLICQPLSSYALIVFPVKYWVMFNMISWSIVTACTGAAKNFTGLVICRILLGAFEATILPSFVLITQMWWTRREQSYRTIAYQVANSMAAIIGPLLSYGIGHVNSGILPYQGIFIFMGCLSFAISPLVWYLLPNSPTTAKFLRKGNDRLIALERLRENNTGTKSSKIKWSQVWETFKDLKTWMWAGMFFCCATPSGGFGAFGGLITQGFGFNSFQTVLMQMPTGAIGIIILLISIWLTNKFKVRFVIIAALCIPPIAGATALTQVSRSNTRGLLASYYVAQMLAALQPLLYSWANLNAAGTTKRVVTTATMFVFQCVGNVVGPQVYLTREAPYYHTGLYVDIACWSILFVLVLTMGAYLAFLNRRKAHQRAALGLPADLKDMSIMNQAEAAQYKIELTERLRAQGFDETKLYEAAFDDMTDFENPTFMYVL
ncbi:hypothetical protein EHS25_008003 [Saitozyma podzolica]|uniref:Major facilitator superfamily (MFS) profile domain-containing protein n=1 Tax=Saitozyma podzolica TaxID=1890683 RepID=A0A427YN51_9TREE|nr:hypothetical protein EHS25_008003 [Saitozyma podzolica]